MRPRRFARYPLSIGAALAAAAVWCAPAWAPPRYADLRVTVAAPAATASEQVAVFRVGVHNAGPDSSLDTILRYRVDGGTLIRAAASRGSCDAEGTCALGLMGYRNLAHDARATVRLLVRADEPGRIAVHAAAASSSLAMEITPENTAADGVVTVAAYAGARPAADLAAAVVAVSKRTATLRVTNLGPDPAGGVTFAGKRLGELAVGAERSVQVAYRSAGRHTAAAATATPDPVAANDRVTVRVR